MGSTMEGSKGAMGSDQRGFLHPYRSQAIIITLHPLAQATHAGFHAGFQSLGAEQLSCKSH